MLKNRILNSNFVKKHFVTDKLFLVSMLSIAVPIALQNVIGLSVTLMDNLMLGQLGDVALAAASLGGQPFFILMIIGFGFSSGGTVLIAQYWGKGDINVIRQIISLTMRILLVFSITFSVVSFFFAEEILGFYSSEPEVIKAGAEYLSTLSISFVLYSTANCFLSCLRAVELVRASTVIYGISFFVNVFFNYMFIFGEFGAPELGVRGAAVGTVIARFSELSMVIFYMYAVEKRLKMRIHHFFKFNRSLLPDYIKYSLPVVGNELLWSFGSTATTMIIGQVGSHFVAANSINNLVFQLVSVTTFGIASSACVICGKSIGRGDTKLQSQKIAHSLLFIVFCLAVIGSALVLTFGRFVPYLFNVTQQSHDIATQMIFVTGLVLPVLGIDVVNIIGILRGGGDTRFTLVLDAMSIWCVSIPLGLLAAFVFKFPPVFIYLAIRMDSFFKVCFSLPRVLSGKWIRNVTRDDIK